MAKMTKSQILGALAENSGLAKKDVVTLMDELFLQFLDFCRPISRGQQVLFVLMYVYFQGAPLAFCIHYRFGRLVQYVFLLTPLLSAQKVQHILSKVRLFHLLFFLLH